MAPQTAQKYPPPTHEREKDEKKRKKARLRKGMNTHTQRVTTVTDTTTNKRKRTHTTRERMRDTTNRWGENREKSTTGAPNDGWMDGWKEGRMEERMDGAGHFFFFKLWEGRKWNGKSDHGRAPRREPGRKGHKGGPLEATTRKKEKTIKRPVVPAWKRAQKSTLSH